MYETESETVLSLQEMGLGLKNDSTSLPHWQQTSSFFVCAEAIIPLLKVP